MEEIWKDIKGYEGLYQISNFGNIKSVERIAFRNKTTFKKKEKLLSPFLNRNGYLAIVLWKDGKYKMTYIHRLVTLTFIQNVNKLEQVNHKDGNKLNNRVDNLEWCSRSDNIKHAVKCGLITKEKIYDTINKMMEKVKKPVLQMKKGVVIAEHESATRAERVLGHHSSNISACCRGKLKTCYGFEWKWKL